MFLDELNSIVTLVMRKYRENVLDGDEFHNYFVIVQGYHILLVSRKKLDFVSLNLVIILGLITKLTHP